MANEKAPQYSRIRLRTRRGFVTADGYGQSARGTSYIKNSVRIRVDGESKEARRKAIATALKELNSQTTLDI